MWISICSPTFFAWYTHPESYDTIDSYKKILNENVFSCMELMKLSYYDIIVMPIFKFYELLKWKQKLEEEKSKIMKQNQEDMRYKK